MEKALEQAAKDEREAGVKSIVEDTIKELGINSNKDGDKLNELASSVKKLVDFIAKGGEVDFVMLDEEEGSGAEEEATEDVRQRRELRLRFKEVRQLEKEVKRLEDKRR